MLGIGPQASTVPTPDAPEPLTAHLQGKRKLDILCGIALLSLLKAHASSFAKPGLFYPARCTPNMRHPLWTSCLICGCYVGSSRAVTVSTWTSRAGPELSSEAWPAGGPLSHGQPAPGWAHLTLLGSRNQEETLVTTGMTTLVF